MSVQQPLGRQQLHGGGETCGAWGVLSQDTGLKYFQSDKIVRQRARPDFRWYHRPVTWREK